MHTPETDLAPVPVLPDDLLATRLAPDQHPAAVFIARLAPGSRPTMRQSLDVIAAELGATVETLPWWALRYAHTQAIRARLAATFAPATANKILTALRGVLREAMRLGLMDPSDYTRATDLPGIRGTRLPKGRGLTPGEIRALFSACDASTTQGCRDAALLGLLYGAGLRRAEAVGLDVEHCEETTGAIKILGKGNKERGIFVTNGSAAALAGWLAVRGRAPGPLFLPVDKAGHIHFRRLTGHAVLVILRRLATRAGVAAFSPHDLRRSHISDLLELQVDVSTVAQMVGHAQVTTTARYDRRGERARRRAVELLHVPYEAP